MKRVKCPCCGYFSHEVEDTLINTKSICGICKICFWQYDNVAHDMPDVCIGANDVSLDEAQSNYKKYSICEIRFFSEKNTLVREPLSEELPENNQE